MSKARTPTANVAAVPRAVTALSDLPSSTVPDFRWRLSCWTVGTPIVIQACVGFESGSRISSHVRLGLDSTLANADPTGAQPLGRRRGAVPAHPRTRSGELGAGLDVLAERARTPRMALACPRSRWSRTQCGGGRRCHANGGLCRRRGDPCAYAAAAPHPPGLEHGRTSGDDGGHGVQRARLRGPRAEYPSPPT